MNGSPQPGDFLGLDGALTDEECSVSDVIRSMLRDPRFRTWRDGSRKVDFRST